MALRIYFYNMAMAVCAVVDQQRLALTFGASVCYSVGAIHSNHPVHRLLSTHCQWRGMTV